MSIATQSRPRGNAFRILESLSGLPVPASDPPVLVIAVGLPGAGKSTFSRRLAPAIGAVILESDALRRLLYGRPTHSPEESAGLFRAIHAATRRLLGQGISVIIDATNLAESHRRPLYEIAEVAGARPVIALFEAPESVIEARLAQRLTSSDLADRSAADIEVYKRMQPQLEPVRRRHWTVDTSDEKAVDAAFDSICKFIFEHLDERTFARR